MQDKAENRVVDEVRYILVSMAWPEKMWQRIFQELHQPGDGLPFAQSWVLFLFSWYGMMTIFYRSLGLYAEGWFLLKSTLGMTSLTMAFAIKKGRSRRIKKKNSYTFQKNRNPTENLRKCSFRENSVTYIILYVSRRFNLFISLLTWRRNLVR